MARTQGVHETIKDKCDEIAQVIAGQNFEQLHPDHRVKVYDLAIKESMADDLYEIRCWFEQSRLFDGLPNNIGGGW